MQLNERASAAGVAVPERKPLARVNDARDHLTDVEHGLDLIFAAAKNLGTPESEALLFGVEQIRRALENAVDELEAAANTLGCGRAAGYPENGALSDLGLDFAHADSC